ncbi:MAG: NADH-quinone oxidoreductase subunit NuoE [Sulfuricaulis sp.]|uniref:NADH-quinone oxidoreductase subunit NuoE n=1 Tax=Sulfuricaulis sp. TaxID=2003553 RepID=UPI0025F218FE|nr:NADH-quinone oxidoreductase subunit NuoE [Sulfuricaulis sp.]MCR4347407.1 NADH-quinone oxidoreductase subunit NuoE [Sulfuricaulis sp.]
MKPQSNTVPKTGLLSESSRAEIDRWITKYPPDRKQAAVMAALSIAQEQNGGWLSVELIEAVAEYLEIPPIAAHEVATFYTMYDLKPVGRHKVCVCTNISCQLNGSSRIMNHIQKRLGIKPGETTTGGKFTLKEVECLAACGGAPMMMIGKKYYENLTPERVDEILGKLE